MGTTFLRAEARSVLARNRIDLAPIRIGVHGDVIRLQGNLARVAGLPPLGFEGVEYLERELRRIRGVRRVELQVDNWHRKGNEWRPAEGRAFELKAGALPGGQPSST